ncbi:glycosyltransferase [Streptococcus porcinus]|uniref:Glycosyl transferase, group 2 family protein n=1 Tax=Streptococcus porcinus TaxID=1340 RepID=A0A4V0H6J2_STRPO|nr:glycosyltransferase [Streptococcus porcinus]VTT44432.1 glycosyl transferase, group 2 family protein [Streptococcus porcinus]VTT45730.1 glycosyl transferase, group 2 family protein [Streptococcus porcinus]
MPILAGIVTFNPEIQRLKENIEAIKPQVDKVIIVDNGSQNCDEICQVFPDLTIIKLNENLGIATALNKIGNYAIEYAFDWFLTLDQDTVVFNDLIANYKSYINLPNVGILTCLFKDINKTSDESYTSEYEEVTKCITSAAFMKTSVFAKSDKFDEKMFIDLVDYDLNYHYEKLGYKTYRINKIGFLHEIGNASPIKFLGRDAYTSNHSAFRKYYFARNTIYLSKKYGFNTETKNNYIVLRDEFIKIVCFEKQKLSKVLAMGKGIIEGIFMKVDSNGR